MTLPDAETKLSVCVCGGGDGPKDFRRGGGTSEILVHQGSG